MIETTTSTTPAGVSRFDAETEPVRCGDGQWSAGLYPEWNIGPNPNGGYAAMPVVRAMRELTGDRDPLTVTSHFLRPAQSGTDCDVVARLHKHGRSTSTASGTLAQKGVDRVACVGTFSELSFVPLSRLTVPRPDLPPPDNCVDRHGLEVGVPIPLAQRIDVRIDPAHAVAGRSATAVVRGWARFVDGRPPDSLSLIVFSDAFPPSAYALLGSVGWIATVELTVQIGRHPVDGWICAEFVCVDITGDRVIEDGVLWDESGQAVARSRQISQLVPPRPQIDAASTP